MWFPQHFQMGVLGAIMQLKGTWTKRLRLKLFLFFCSLAASKSLISRKIVYVKPCTSSSKTPKIQTFLIEQEAFRRSQPCCCILTHFLFPGLQFALSRDHLFIPKDAKQMTSRHVCIIFITFTTVQCNFPNVSFILFQRLWQLGFWSTSLHL